MKPLRLEMQAFGPFARRESVDFTQLGERATLFLIHGPTGAGKTSLLDAMCFALYGDTSGGERDARAMRSDHAPGELETEVCFEFELGVERYRVGRRPAQRRKKKRGEGWREIAASAWLERAARDGGWTSLATQPGRVSEEIRVRLGFDSAQFRQVIVLPQGRFRELLTARSAEREAILETLFDTELQRRLADSFKARARELGERNAHLRTERETVLRHAGFDSAEALQEAYAERAREREELLVREAGLRTGVDAANRALEAGRRLAAAFEESESARRAVAELEARAEEAARWRASLDRARAAEAVRPLDEAAQAAARELAAHEARATERARALQAARKALLTAREAAGLIEQLEGEQEQTARRLAQLAGLRERVTALDAARKAAAGLECERDTARTALGTLERTLSAATDALTEVQARHEAARREAEASAWLEHEVRAAEAEHARRERVVGLRAESVRYRKQVDAARRALETAESALEKGSGERDALEEAWLAMHAARLAATLVPGQPCPVCGAHEHPQPALGEVAAEGYVDEARLRAAREAMARALDARDRARASLHEEEKALAAIEARLAGEEAQQGAAADAGSDHVTAAAPEALRERLAVARRAAQTLAPLAERIAQERARVDELTRQRSAVESECRRIEARHAEAGGELRALENVVPEALRDPACLEHEVDALEAALRESRLRCERLRFAVTEAGQVCAAAEAADAAAREAVARAREARETAAERLALACVEHGFGTHEAWRAACLEREAREALEQRVDAYRQALAAAHERRERAQRVVVERQPPDLDALAGAAREAASRLEQHVLAVQEASRKAAECARAREAVEALDARMGEAAKAYAVVGRLSELANGNNALRMTFQRFVLATLLDEVLEAASLRLAQMSRGRFELQRVRGVTDLRSAGGLELEVFDHYTGTARPANTLSGGEGFLASLALALGLADCVQSRSGGVRMDTLFIDEGFGTLDPESLDFALRTLIDLQQGGRMIGLISHVAELRERIDVRLEVCPAADGSHVRVHDAAQ